MSDEKNTTTDPGHTPGQAEGTEDINDQSEREPDQTSRTQDQAEGGLEEVEK